MFNQDTALMKILSDPTKLQFYVYTLLLLAMTIFGIRGIKIVK